MSSSRLLTVVAPAVALAAARSGVAARPITDIEDYRQSLEIDFAGLRPKKDNRGAQRAPANAEGPAQRRMAAALA